MDNKNDIQQFFTTEMDIITNSDSYQHDMTCPHDYRVGDCMWTEQKCLQCKILIDKYNRSIS